MQGDYLSFAEVFGNQEAESQPQASTSKAPKGNSESDKRSTDRRSYERKRKGKAAAAALTSTGTPWTDSVDWNPRRKSAIEQLQAEMEAFYECVRPRPEEHRLREKVVNSIRTAVGDKYRDATIHPFGSFTTELYLPSGDIDLVVMAPSLLNQAVKGPLFSIAGKLKQKNILRDITVIHKARVPIIKGTSVQGGFNIDISINQHSGLKAAPLVKNLIHAISEKASRCLIMIVKALLAERGLHEVYSGGLGSYSVICLVISFLQMHPEIQAGRIDPAENLGVLLIEFLELYGNHFNFDIAGISVLGRGGYFDKVQRGWMMERQTFLLSIEDPQDTDNDVSKGSRNILDVRRNFWGAHEMLTNALYERQRLLEERRPDEEACSQSLLGCIIQLPDSVRQARERNQSLIESLKLSREPSPPPVKRVKREEPSQPPSPALSSEVNEDSFNTSSMSHLPAYALEDGELPPSRQVKQEASPPPTQSVRVEAEPQSPMLRHVKREASEGPGLPAPVEDRAAAIGASRGVKREASPVDLTDLRPVKSEDEESRYAIHSKNGVESNQKRRKVANVNPASSSEDSSEMSTEEDSSLSDSDNEVANDLILNTGQSNHQGKHNSGEADEKRPSLPGRTSSNKAARQAYWAGKGVKSEE